MFRATTAGALYAITVFLIGFILGTIRVLLLAPHLGETTAVFPVQMAFDQLGSRDPFGSRFQQAEPTHLGLGQESSGVRAPQRKIIHLAEFFEAIWGVDGHEYVQISGSR